MPSYSLIRVAIASTTVFLAACAPMSVEQAVPQGRIIPVTAELWKFTPNIIQAKQGETVTLRITGASGTHGIAIPGLGINEIVIQGQTIQVNLPTDTPGTYDFFCSIQCGSGHSEMKGQIIIEP